MSAREYLIALVAAIALLAIGVALSRLMWKRQVRRSLVRLFGRREAIAAARKVLIDAIGRLSRADDEELARFATDLSSEERKAFADVKRRMELERDELETMALPKRLQPAAEMLADVAGKVVEEAGKVGESFGPDEVLEALSRLDLSASEEGAAAADEELRRLCESSGCEEVSVYGGGLYI